MRKYLAFIAAWAMILVGAFVAHQVQTAGGAVSVQEVRIPTEAGVSVSGLLYVPAAATVARPAPAVLASHGYINTREMQSPFAIELARRGVVVLAMDMTGHGYSGGIVGTAGFGGPAALRHLQGLPFVDRTRIGLAGHSMGGGPILAAAAAQPDAYRALVLVGSTPGLLGAAAPASPRNLALVFGRYEEFAELMWQVPTGADVVRSKRLLALFGTEEAIEPGRVYGDPAAGTARVLYVPPITHPGEHFANSSVGPTIAWLERNLSAGQASPPASDQVWIWKELGTLTALAGFVLLLLTTLDLLLRAPFFRQLATPGEAVRERRDGRWWLAAALTAAVPALTYLPLMEVGQLFFPMPVFPQWVQNQLLVWALANALLTLVIVRLLRGPKLAVRSRWVASAMLAAAVVGVGYASLALADALFKVDYRIWVVGLKPLSAARALTWLPYFALWSLFFLVAIRALAGLAIRGERLGAGLLAAAGAMSLGFVLFVAAQYAPLFATGGLLTPAEPLNVIVAMQFVPLLAIVGVIGAYAWRRTGSHVPGALICAALISWYITAGTANHWAPGFAPQVPGAARSR